jgi:multidrug efflux pump subunit AcrA (membrane-fusion protein)
MSYQSLNPDEFLPPIRRWTTLGTIALLSVFGASIAIAATVRYNLTVQAPGIVRPLGDIRLVQASRGGTLAQVVVQENQAVQRGDVIAELVPDASLATGGDRPPLADLKNRQQQLQAYIQQYENRRAYIDAQLQTEALDEGNRDRLLQQRTALETQLAYDQKALQTVETDLSRWVIQAPMDGTILRLIAAAPGRPIQPGDEIAQLVPQQVPLVIKAQVAAQDISRVQQGQAVVLRVSAYPYPDYGTLNGTVQTIAPDVTAPNALPARAGGLVGQPTEFLGGLASPYYTVVIQTERSALQRGDRTYPLQPGMEVKADIIAEQETVLQTFLRQLRLWSDL